MARQKQDEWTPTLVTELKEGDRLLIPKLALQNPSEDIGKLPGRVVEVSVTSVREIEGRFQVNSTHGELKPVGKRAKYKKLPQKPVEASTAAQFGLEAPDTFKGISIG